MCTWKLFDSSLTLTGCMPCTVSPVEKLTNRTTVRYSSGTVEVRSWYGRSAVVVRSRFGRGAVKVLSRYAPDSLVVRHAQGSFTPAILA